MQILDPPEQLLIELNGIPVLRQNGSELALDLLESGARVRTRQIEEHVRHFVQKRAALLQGDDGIPERGLLFIRTNGGNLRLVLGKRLLECGPVVLGLNSRERGQSVRRAPRRQKRIGCGLGLERFLAHGVRTSSSLHAASI